MWVHVSMCVRVRMFVHVRMSACMLVCMRVRVYVHASERVRAYVNMSVCVKTPQLSLPLPSVWNRLGHTFHS